MYKVNWNLKHNNKNYSEGDEFKDKPTPELLACGVIEKVKPEEKPEPEKEVVLEKQPEPAKEVEPKKKAKGK